MGKLIIIVAVVVVVMAAMWSKSGQPPTPRPQASTREAKAAASSSKAHPDDGQQSERMVFIDELIHKHGVLMKVGYDGGSAPKAWVTDAFLKLDEKTQNSFLSVVYAYYNIEDDDFGISENVHFRDRLILKVDNGTINGLRIGDYDPFDGISLK